MFGALLQNVQLIVIYLTTPHNWKLCIAATLDSSFAAGLLSSGISWTPILILLLSLGLQYWPWICCWISWTPIVTRHGTADNHLGTQAPPMIGRCTYSAHIYNFIIFILRWSLFLHHPFVYWACSFVYWACPFVYWAYWRLLRCHAISWSIEAIIVVIVLLGFLDYFGCFPELFSCTLVARHN